MADHFPLMVPGAKPDERHAEVHAPYDGSVIGTVERTDLTGVEVALENAHRLFRNRDAWLGARRDSASPMLPITPAASI